MTDWDIRFLELAKYISQWSKDPSTKVGAVIARPDKTIASVGYNGFPRGIADDERLAIREIKYQLVVHAEMNAILNAQEPLIGYHLFVYFPSFGAPICNNCAKHVIQSGIVGVTGYLAKDNDETALRWKEDSLTSARFLTEANLYVNLKARDNVTNLFDWLPSQPTNP